jgi:two-component sensor histidine kinase
LRWINVDSLPAQQVFQAMAVKAVDSDIALESHDMIIMETLQEHAPVFPISGTQRTAASYELELIARRDTEARLREILARGEELLHQKDQVIEFQALMRKESDHRFLNDMQIVVSLLSMQSQTVGSAEAAAQLLIAANRVNMITRIHRRLHGFDGMNSVAFKQYLEEFCHEFSVMISSRDGVERIVVAKSAEIELPASKAVPLAFIVSELLTNAVKHGDGQIKVWLERDSDKGYLLSVSNNGPRLPDNFDPAACKGLGMRIIQSFVRKIGGEMRFGPVDADQGARFSISFH